MTELLEKAIEAVRRMPTAEQDHIAQAMFSIARIGAPEQIDPADLPDVLQGLAEIERGDIATDAEVAEAFRAFER